MSYISRFVFNPERQGARRLLSNPHMLHAAICKGFEEDELEKHPLWVVDTSRRDPNLFIVSEHKPDLTHIQEVAGRFTSAQQSAGYKTLDNVSLGREYLFKIKVNPLIKKGSQRIPLVKDEDIINWLLKRSEVNGFEIVQSENNGLEIAVAKQEIIKFKKYDTRSSSKMTVTQNSAVLQGRLKVTDVEHFRKVLTTGVGTNRSYGCGLLLIEG